MTNVIVKAAVKDALREIDVASDLYDVLDEEVQNLLDDTERRAQKMVGRRCSSAIVVDGHGSGDRSVWRNTLHDYALLRS